MVTLADRLKDSRKSNNLTQAELGKMLGVGKTTVSMYETSNSTPSDEIKLKIAKYSNISLDYLLWKTDIKNYTEDSQTTIALNSDLDYNDLPQEAKDEIYNFIKCMRQKQKNKQ
ncbi:helix-turn-helix domain-containing protein [Clostridium chromiireducens]|uniref:helix-turn-helix domain-containing protein n=1 Tax=Clostridium chromiireducens TaxID=225345 RepID=UPI003AF525D9